MSLTFSDGKPIEGSWIHISSATPPFAVVVREGIVTSPIRTISLVTLATFGLFALCGNAKAAEGGGSHYLPGTVGDITIAHIRLVTRRLAR